MMDSMPCITCQSSLRDHGKITPDWQWAYCTICDARYEVVPALDEFGVPQKAADGHTMFYLNPVAPGKAQFYRESEDALEQTPTDFEKLKNAIRNVETVNDLLESLKKL